MSRYRLVQLLLFGMALCACSCHSPPPPSQTQKTIDAFTVAERQVTQTRDYVRKTLSSLRHYCDRPGQSAYQLFDNNARSALASGEKLPDVGAVMTDQANAFFAEWDRKRAAMTNEELKAYTGAQKERAEKAFRKIDLESSALRSAYGRFVADSTNLRTFFEYDKSAAGVTAASKLTAAMTSDGAELERQFNSQIDNIRSAKAIFALMVKD